MELDVDVIESYRMEREWKVEEECNGNGRRMEEEWDENETKKEWRWNERGMTMEWKWIKIEC